MSVHNPIYTTYLLRSGYALSDEDWKEVEGFDPDDMARALMSRGPISGNDLQFLHERAKEKTGKDFDQDLDLSDDWDDDLVDQYARWIGNSHYTYKPEATQIDSEIDPNEEHIGPMAQEIEKVNPACIEPTQEGVKTVDTSRLALMNAGAIGALGRRVNKQEELLEAIAAKLGAL